VLRPEGKDAFSADHLAIAKYCGVVALAALAARNSGKLEAEIERLQRLVGQMQRREHGALQTSQFLKEIVDHLPMSVSVQDDKGRFALVNAVAAANLEIPAESLIGASPADFLPENDAISRREWEKSLISSGQVNSVEENMSGPMGERTWLTSHKAVRILNQPLLLTTSVDITQ